MNNSFFFQKKITLVGLGLLGRGVGDAEFLAKSGANLIVTDLKRGEELEPSLERLRNFPNIRYTLGKHEMKDFLGRDIIIKAPNMPLDSPYLEKARSDGAHITMSTALFAKLSNAFIVGVTGTRGKTTTTQLIYNILKKSGEDVGIGGNVKGVSTLAMLPETQPNSVFVLELDSWQLQGFREEKISPQISVFTNFYPDHMDYYKGDMNTYLDDKAQIFLHQKPGNKLIVGEQAEPIIKENYGKNIVADTIVAKKESIPKSWRLKLPGEHNKQNVACAVEATLAFGADKKSIWQAVDEFGGVPGRLELVRNINGVKIYNDTNSTTPEATIAGLRALKSEREKNIILIMGGHDKNLSMEELWKEIEKSVKKLILIPGTGTDRMIKEQKIENYETAESLKKTVKKAFKHANNGDVILFSPALASFGLFKNEYDRGEKFNKVVKKLR